MYKTSISMNPMQKPFLRWAGGKQQILKYLLSYLPKDINQRDYYEPFLGAGSLFLSISPQHAFLSDLNILLINCYTAIKKNPAAVYRELQKHKPKHSEQHYYLMRNKFNENITNPSFAQAARFIYLNRTSFNGIFRVNQKGYYNVPFDHRKRLFLPSHEMISKLSQALQNASLNAYDYKSILPLVKNGDFIYLDPPYPALNGTSYFTHYTKERFTSNDQKALSEFATELDKKGCLVLISNANTFLIRNLFSDWNIQKINVTRFISTKAVKHKVSEVIISNYSLEG